jgi:hypothetical protein
VTPPGSPSLWGETAMIARGVASSSGGDPVGSLCHQPRRATTAGENSRSKRSASSELLNAISNPMLL